MGALLSYGVVFGYSALIFYISSRPIGVSRLPPGTDKIIHFFEYGVLSLLWLNALLRFGLRGQWRRAAWIAAALAIGYGITDEIHQAFVPLREASWADVLANGFGVGVCLGIVYHLRGRAFLDRSDNDAVSSRKD